jgi:thiamine-phosphate pyrophosphorylase
LPIATNRCWRITMFSKLQYISQGKIASEHFLNIKQVLDAGCTWIQLRIKQKEELLKIAEKVKLICQEYQATFIINDFIEIANQVSADGVHLGLGDESIENARETLGKNKIIGGTANTIVDVKQRIMEKVDYIGLGPLRFTQTKQNLSPVLGLDGYKNILSTISQNKIPIYAIGGVEMEDIAQLFDTGIYGIAISGMLTRVNDKKKCVKRINQLFYE